MQQCQWQGYRAQGANAGVSSIVPIIEPQLLTGVTRALDSAKSTTMANILAEASVTLRSGPTCPTAYLCRCRR